jgi:transcriptional regulator with XRE-family HTH domain
MLEAPPEDGDETVTTAAAECAPDPALERVARALRSARARTGLSEEQIVAMLNQRGAAISLLALRRAERVGTIDLALAARLADIYGMTTDTLAGRRPNSWQFAPAALAL